MDSTLVALPARKSLPIEVSISWVIDKSRPSVERVPVLIGPTLRIWSRSPVVGSTAT